jgi:flagellar motility protein MotE (MotC chaperone)
MKPKDAAEIMNKLDMKNLKTIVQMMNKRKASEVLGFMDKAKVRELTVAMMNQKTPFASSTQSNG